LFKNLLTGGTKKGKGSGFTNQPEGRLTLEIIQKRLNGSDGKALKEYRTV